MLTHKHSFPQVLLNLGWDSYFQKCWEALNIDNSTPCRIVGVHKNRFLIRENDTEKLTSASGRLYFQKNSLFPVTGDWVLVKDKIISMVLPRKNALSRGTSGTRKQGEPSGKEQVLAANLDTVFIVCGLDRDFNIRRLERYLTLVYNCGLTPAIILTKADLHPDPDACAEAAKEMAFGVPVHVVSATDSTGLVNLEAWLSQGRTIAMIGSSGAGKSTLVNRLYGKPIQVTQDISERIGKGRHTTTGRSLIQMPQGGMVIDNPGIREIGLWDDGNGLDAAFPEIDALAAACRFHDCTHTHEPDCQVLQGIASGSIRQDRLDSYRKLKRELAYVAIRQEKSASRVEKERWKKIRMKIKQIKK